jgi:putative spermidine/putrescine transport system ATP-binding protein
MVFQNYALFPHMTAARNVAFPLKMRGLKPNEIRPKVDRILDLVGLKRFADKHPRELSGGQQQRVALARGLVFDPDILLLDEPLGALDKNLREQMQVEIKRIQRETGITTIYVTHDQTEAMTMSDMVAVFSNGKLEQVGPPLEIYNRPMTQFVAQFIGDSNLFDAQIDPSRPGWASVEGIGTVRLEANAPSYVAGSVCGLLVRPERICVVTAGQSDDALNSIDVQVRSVIHYGDSALVIANAPNGASVRMRIAGSLPVGLGEGKTLRVGWAPADGHLIMR